MECAYDPTEDVVRVLSGELLSGQYEDCSYLDCGVNSELVETSRRRLSRGVDGVYGSAYGARWEPTAHSLISEAVQDIRPNDTGKYSPGCVLGGGLAITARQFDSLSTLSFMEDCDQWLVIYFADHCDKNLLPYVSCDHTVHPSGGNKSNWSRFSEEQAAVVATLPAYCGPAYRLEDERGVYCEGFVYSDSSDGSYSVPCSQTVDEWVERCMSDSVDFQDYYDYGEGYLPCHESYMSRKESYLAVARGSSFEKLCYTTAISADAARDPMRSCVWVGVAGQSLCCDVRVRLLRSVRAGGSCLMIPITSQVKRGSPVLAAYWSSGECTLVPVTCWRRFSGSRVYIDLDVCPRCHQAGPSWPYYRRNCCGWMRAFEGRVQYGVYEVGGLSPMLRDFLDGYHRYGSPSAYCEQGYVLASWVHVPVFPTLCSLICGVGDGLSILKPLLQCLLASVAVGVITATYTVTELEQGGWSSYVLIKEFGTAGKAIAGTRIEAAEWGACDALLAWLVLQPHEGWACGVLFQAFMAFRSIPREDILKYCLGAYSRCLGVPTLARLCAMTIGHCDISTWVLDSVNDNPTLPWGLFVDVDGAAASVSVSGLLDAIARERDGLRVRLSVLDLWARHYQWRTSLSAMDV